MNWEKMFCGMRFIVYLLGAFLLYSFEHSLIINLGSFTAAPILIPTLVVFVALFEGEIFGSVFAFCAGLLVDLGFGVPLGIYAALLGILGYFFGVLANYFINAGFWITWLFSSFTGILILTLRLFTNYGRLGFGALGNIILETYLPVMIYTILISPIVIWSSKLIFYYIRSARGENK